MDDKVKFRLIGGAVLIALAVILAPYLVKESTLPSTKIVNSPQSLPTPPAKPQVSTAKVQDFTPPRLASIDLDKAPMVAKQTVKVPERYWELQVASFKSVSQARRLERKLIKQGFAAYVKTSSSHSMSRVFVGPQRSHHDAKHVAANLRTRFKLRSIIRRRG